MVNKVISYYLRQRESYKALDLRRVLLYSDTLPNRQSMVFTLAVRNRGFKLTTAISRML